MADQYALGRLRHAGLSAFDVKMLTTLMQTGGETGFPMSGIAEENRSRVIAGLSSLADRNLIMVDEARSTVSRFVLRLTDAGREVCSQLEKMSVQPRVEVQMNGATPEVIKQP